MKLTTNFGNSVLLLDRNLSSHLRSWTMAVAKAPQMTLQKYLFIFPCLSAALRESANPIPVHF